MQQLMQQQIRVSIHAFRGEGDTNSRYDATMPRSFNPRLPGGRRPIIATGNSLRPPVSIHAFRGEGDGDAIHAHLEALLFQSTPSGGKATLTTLPKGS